MSSGTLLLVWLFAAAGRGVYGAEAGVESGPAIL